MTVCWATGKPLLSQLPPHLCDSTLNRSSCSAQASNHVKRKLKQRTATRKLDQNVADQFTTGRLYACISSRPGQCGRCDGYILEGKELEFYVKKMQKKKSKAA